MTDTGAGTKEYVDEYNALIKAHPLWYRQKVKILLVRADEELATLRMQLEATQKEAKEAGEACLMSTANTTFIKGADIPNTIEAARAALVHRCEKAESQLARANALADAEMHRAMVAESDAADLRKDAERYRFLCEEAYLYDRYDSGANQSSWDWTIELPTGKSKGMYAPADTPTFEQTIDACLRQAAAEK